MNCIWLEHASSKKSWYEQTLEEDGEETELSPLEAHFSSSFKIGDPNPAQYPSMDIELLTANQTGVDPSSPVVPLITENEDHLREVKALAKEWEINNKDALGRVDLDWTEEDEVAFQEAGNSLTEAGDFMADDDLLGEEAIERVSALPPAHQKLDRPKSKGKRIEPKKDYKKRELNSKAHLGPTDLYGAASKKLLNLHGRVSPKCYTTISIPIKLKHSKSSSNPPTQHVCIASESFGKGESSLPSVPNA